jgi:hypothetical protein
MRYVSCIAAAAALAGALAGCSNSYYPRSSTSQAYYYPSGYNTYPASYNTYPAYRYPANDRYAYSGYEYRNYKGIHPGPEQTYP